MQHWQLEKNRIQNLTANVKEVQCLILRCLKNLRFFSSLRFCNKSQSNFLELYTSKEHLFLSTNLTSFGSVQSISRKLLWKRNNDFHFATSGLLVAIERILEIKRTSCTSLPAPHVNERILKRQDPCIALERNKLPEKKWQGPCPSMRDQAQEILNCFWTDAFSVFFANVQKSSFASKSLVQTTHCPKNQYAAAHQMDRIDLIKR